MFVYRGKSSTHFLLRIFLGSDDGVMWYIPWILSFYILFYFIYKICKEHWYVGTILLFIVCVIQTVVFELMHIGSQWYTSNGALIAGIVVAEYPLRERITLRLAGLFSLFLCVCLFFSRKCVGVIFLKDAFTALSGVFFVLVVFILAAEIQKRFPRIYSFKILQYLGSISLWIYMVHMKIAVLLEKYKGLNLITFLLLTIGVAIILSTLWSKGKQILLKSNNATY